MEVKVDASEITRLAELLKQTPQVVAAARRAAIAAAAPKLKAVVDEEIGGTGKVRDWQGQYIGSKGFYAAVRPKKRTWTEATKKKKHVYAVGYVTNAINSGHRFPPPSGRKGYRPKILSGKMTVAGRQFYQRAPDRLGQISDEAAESIGKAVVSHFSSF